MGQFKPNIRDILYLTMEYWILRPGILTFQFIFVLPMLPMSRNVI